MIIFCGMPMKKGTQLKAKQNHNAFLLFHWFLEMLLLLLFHWFLEMLLLLLFHWLLEMLLLFYRCLKMLLLLFHCIYQKI